MVAALCWCCGEGDTWQGRAEGQKVIGGHWWLRGGRGVQESLLRWKMGSCWQLSKGLCIWGKMFQHTYMIYDPKCPFQLFLTLELWSEINIFQSVFLSLLFTVPSATKKPSFLTYLVPLFQVGLPSMMWSAPMQLLSLMISPMGCIGLKYPAVRLVYSTQRPFWWQRLQKSLQSAVLPSDLQTFQFH